MRRSKEVMGRLREEQGLMPLGPDHPLWESTVRAMQAPSSPRKPPTPEQRAIERKRSRHRRLAVKYGLSPEAFEAMLETQGNQCGACGLAFGESTRDDPHVDHDHATGAVRGLLCRRCNLALGFARDDPATLRGLLRYLEGAAAVPSERDLEVAINPFADEG
jgi:Recombination endonuclease VII